MNKVFDDINDLIDFIDRSFRKAFRRALRKARRMGIFDEFEIPRSDIIDEGDKYVIEIELPGVSKEDIEIYVRGDMLEVKAKRKEEVRKKEENYIRLERYYSGFRRIFVLPMDADKENIKAKFENGLLRIEIKKKPGSEGKKINID